MGNHPAATYSLKQKHVTAFTVLKRLNSYYQHHPLYLALRELGGPCAPNSCSATWTARIRASTLTISWHTFAQAVFYGQNGQFRYAGKEEQ